MPLSDAYHRTVVSMAAAYRDLAALSEDATADPSIRRAADMAVHDVLSAFAQFGLHLTSPLVSAALLVAT